MRERKDTPWTRPPLKDIEPLTDKVRESVYETLCLLNDPVDPARRVKFTVRQAIKFSLKDEAKLKHKERRAVALIDRSKLEKINEAGGTLAMSHYRMGDVAAHRFVRTHPDFPLASAQAAAMEAIFKSILYFDASRGFRFDTYISPVISQSLNRAYAEEKTGIEVSNSALSALQTLRFAKSLLEQTLDQAPSIAEIAIACQILLETKKKVKADWELEKGTKTKGFNKELKARIDEAIKKALGKEAMQPLQARVSLLLEEPEEIIKGEPLLRAKRWGLVYVGALLQLDSRLKGPLSLDHPVRVANNDETVPLSSYLPDEQAASEDRVIQQYDIKTVLQLIFIPGFLEARDLKILVWHYGLDGEDPLSNREIGKRLGLSRERVRQLEQRALAKIRDELGIELSVIEDEDEEEGALKTPRGKKGSGKQLGTML